MFGVPDLGRDEEFVTRDLTSTDGPPEASFVLINLSTVDRSIAKAKGLETALFGVLIGDLPETVTELGDERLIIECVLRDFHLPTVVKKLRQDNWQSFINLE